ncbi:unnamed protein product [Vicia faba]|uniref:Uncharacterized protein n=1 Tax=Vicia faba TaxID=3906 RepID=A0AAV0ZX19_VICFA|nr:unnamed protein product [Vicia faba]
MKYLMISMISSPSCHNFVAEKKKELGQHITFFTLLSFYGLPLIASSCSFPFMDCLLKTDTCVHILGFATILDILGCPPCFVDAAWVDPSELMRQYLFLMPPQLTKKILFHVYGLAKRYCKCKKSSRLNHNFEFIVEHDTFNVISAYEPQVGLAEHLKVKF